MKGNTREVVYQSRYEEERSRLVDVGQRDNQKCGKFPKRMVKTKQDIAEQCITSSDDVLVVRDEDERIVCKNYCEKGLFWIRIKCLRQIQSVDHIS